MAGSLAPQIKRASSAPPRPVRLMIVDDSTVARAVLTRMIETDPQFKVVADAASAEAAIEALRDIDCDIVLLDLEMPGAGGLEKLPEILDASRGAQVLVCSSLAEEGAEATVRALAMGASDTLPKPGTGRFGGTFSDVLLGKLRALATSGAVPKPSAPKRASPRPLIEAGLRTDRETAIEVLLIGASTGGIHALASFFEALPPRIGVPICVTQHLPGAFMPVFARQLARFAGRPCHVAEQGHPLLADRIYIAPGDGHLELRATAQGLMARISRDQQASGCMPAVDPMFASAAEACGERACAIVLTGMGRDGSAGAQRLVACGSAVMAQDEPSSAVWGMPRSIFEQGLACRLGPPAELARHVATRVGGA
ncbi:chemotaxis-specific protein-glutamate methyltransferase CheB [Sphingomicrobium astaxanthinifaciens]|uniref:chemotaxis-specific protein-glutamate methyltransferase CheB n=1 Tax=Sphingomicrobium astaxanthinifaciens TaxID=1227949 RepID=UPI001FCB2DCE|nr:chemotaxis-specific protein-glutamate methyltransferase CheB [Sphingomicrobium astaxanthinifaciens]MCJ7422251.1 chemotaxis-specific protein-glutamate methyltransferase CheB [Sphingomicrobium astaxanthinifaciens]